MLEIRSDAQVDTRLSTRGHEMARSRADAPQARQNCTPLTRAQELAIEHKPLGDVRPWPYLPQEVLEGLSL
jgi:hypothetical protein